MMAENVRPRGSMSDGHRIPFCAMAVRCPCCQDPRAPALSRASKTCVGTLEVVLSCKSSMHDGQGLEISLLSGDVAEIRQKTNFCFLDKLAYKDFFFE